MAKREYLGLFILSILLVFSCVCDGAGLGESCTDTANCTVANSICGTGSTCECNTGYVADGVACYAEYGFACTDVSECAKSIDGTASYTYTVCSGTCTCNTSLAFYYSNECVAKSNFDGPCIIDGDCVDADTTCTGSLCKCVESTYADSGTCKTKLSLGATCPTPSTNVPATAVCSDSNAECSATGGGYTCQCTAGYYDDYGSTNRQCQSKLSLGAGCPPPSTDVPATAVCSDSNAECSATGGGYTCQCTAGYYDDYGSTNRQCQSKLSLGAGCPPPSTDVPATAVCSDSNAECSATGGGYTCQCTAGYYDDYGSTNRQCQSKLSLGATCATPSTDVPATAVCSDSNAECSATGGGYTCQCTAGYYDDYGSTNRQCQSKLSLGATCPPPSTDVPATAVCSDSNAECSAMGGGYTCQCTAGYYDDYGSTNRQCQSKLSLGATCPPPSTDVPATAVCSDSNAECSATGGGYTCQCTAGYYDDYGSTNRQCQSKLSLGAGCLPPSTDVPATAVCSDSNAECSATGGGYTCQCTAGYYDDYGSTNRQCQSKLSLGAGCPPPSTDVPATAVCSDSNAECSATGGGYTCQCTAGYYDDYGSTNRQCQSKLSLGAGCPPPSTDVPATAVCSDSNAECSTTGGGYTCQCTAGYYDDYGSTNRQCQSKLSLGAGCPPPSTDVPATAVCSDSNAECSATGGGYTCQCTAGYYDDYGSTNRQCQSKLSLGAGCPPPSTDVPATAVCSDSNAECSTTGGGYTCQCTAGYYDDYGSTNRQCQSKNPLGAPCNNADECSDSAATCFNNKCTCNDDTYDDNKNTDGGNCRTITELRVSGIVTSSDVRTDQIAVSWTAPAQAQHVSSYTVDWRPIGNNVDDTGSTPDITTTSTVVTGLTPGRAYIFKVISVNKDTSTTARTTFLEKQQATKPNQPGPIDWGGSDLDASDGQIILVWAAGVGDVRLYTVKLRNDFGTVVSDQTTSSRTVSIVRVIASGKTYTLQIVANSQTYDSTQSEQSDAYEVEIKTDVQIPSAPTSVLCGTTTDSSILLSWQPPTFPNGVVQNYLIGIYSYHELASPTHVRDISMTTADIDYMVHGLSPGSYYVFRVYAVNELYNSTDYASDASDYCETKASSAEAPENVLIRDVTSRSLTADWDKPVNTFGELLGFVLQVRDAGGLCVKEYIVTCDSSCTSTFPTSLQGMCGSAVSDTVQLSNQAFDATMSYVATGLLPDITYTITIVAVNTEGKGHEATETATTLEEVPSKPTNVLVVGIQAQQFTVTWNISEPRPGTTTYTVNVHTSGPAVAKEIVETGFNTRQVLVTGLEEYWPYTVTVNAGTSVGNITSDTTAQLRTLQAAPGGVSGFTTLTGDDDGVTYQQVRVHWMVPTELDRNGVISSYTFTHNGTNAPDVPKVVTADVDTSLVHEETLDVVPENSYSLEVYATNNEGMNGAPTTSMLVAPAGVPSDFIGAVVEVIPAQKLTQVGEQSFRINIVRDFMEQSANGVIRDSGLVACAQKMCNSGSVQYSTLEQFQSMPNWNTASKDGYSKYRVTKLGFLDEYPTSGRKRRNTYTEITYTVGVDTCTAGSTQYCNGPLQPDTGFMIQVVTCTSGGCLVSQAYGPFITAAVPPDDPPIGAIVGGVCGGVAFLVIVALVILLLRRRASSKGTTYKSPEEPPNQPAATVVRKRPIPLRDFAAHLDTMHRDSNLLFSQEYADDLKMLSPAHAQEAAVADENRLKNRYVNILPFDHTRVKLSTVNEEDSDYINASYLPGYKSQREYIGCQGPLYGTVDDFWRMVWEQNVSVIVILTLCSEGNKGKCEQYWPEKPNEPKQYGDIVVEVQSYSSIKTFDYRIFRMQLGNQTRQLKHFHFLSWLDFQANVQHSIILDFISQVRSHVQPPDTAGPMIVHCSAGVGRTGTYIILDHLIQYIDDHDFDAPIDIFNMALTLRENRPSMVQTEQQYVFINDCIPEIMERKRKRMAERDVVYENQAFNADEENIYQNTQTGESMYANVQMKTEL